MKVFIYTKNEIPLKNAFPKNVKFIHINELFVHTSFDILNEDISYIDVAAFPASDLKKNILKIKNHFKGSAWGLIDQKGIVKDPAVLFFDGAWDYIGSAAFKSSDGITTKRIKDALQWRKALSGGLTPASGVQPASGEKTASGGAKDAPVSSKEAQSLSLDMGIKLPSTSAFPGWKKMQTGKSMHFYILYCSFRGKSSLDNRLTEKAAAQIHNRFISYLDDCFHDGDGLLWMNSGKDCIFLVPPKAKCAEAIVEACIRITASAPLITLETLNLTIPVNFIFALHYGALSYKPPGRTGTIVSDAVNFIFHLGAKKAEPGRLTISGELPGVSIPKSLQDCFVSAGAFEGRKIWHTKRFSYAKPWG
jgi:hypothetical protein